MSLPNDILLPSNAKYFGMVDQNHKFHSEYDITWSFTYSLTGSEHGLLTFLTNKSTLSGIPGHYLGYTGTIPQSSYITTENDVYILQENGERIVLENGGSDYNGCLAIAFDSSGYFGLSSVNRDGISLPEVKKNILAIRDGNNSLIFYEPLSNINADFSFYDNEIFDYQTLRFRYANSGRKITIEYRKEDELKFQTLTSLEVDLKVNNYGFVNAGFSFCSPISSSLSSDSTLKLKNFHVQGVDAVPTTETLSFTPLPPVIYNSYTTIPKISG